MSNFQGKKERDFNAKTETGSGLSATGGDFASPREKSTGLTLSEGEKSNGLTPSEDGEISLP